MTSVYIRASVAYRMAKGELSRTRKAAKAARRPPMRSPRRHASGRAATAKIPESDRTARSPSPKTRIQRCSRT
jgi:hypothetical protein